MPSRHAERVSEQLREELAALIENELADPRVASVSVAGVDLSRDGKSARVRITLLDTGVSERDCLRGLEHARGFLRHELAERLTLRHTPEISFVIDRGRQNAERVEALLQRLKKRAPLAVLLLICGAARGGEIVRYESSAPAMGGVFTIAAYGPDRAHLAAAVQAAFQEARRIDHLLSNYDSTSELSEVNRDAAAGPVRVSPELFDLLEKCRRYSQASEGAFDWTVGALMRVWGFYKGSGRLPDPAEIERARRSVGYRHVELDADRRSVRFRVPGLELDPGGIGKGYAVDRMAEVLREAGVAIALVSASGSSIYAIGAPPGERGWYVRIRDPKSENITAAEVWLKNESMSSSGSYEKFFEADGKVYSHIMDPRTGYPAQGMLSVSVVAPQTLDSEAWTKPFFVNGAEWTRRNRPEGFRVLLCEQGKPCYWVGGSRGPLL
jgi:thiamine biosynthesis lipoprotein